MKKAWYKRRNRLYYSGANPLSPKISVVLTQKSSVFPNGKSAFFGHTAGDGWNQMNDNRSDEQ
jgi:hypothetical protein